MYWYFYQVILPVFLPVFCHIYIKYIIYQTKENPSCTDLFYLIHSHFTGFVFFTIYTIV